MMRFPTAFLFVLSVFVSTSFGADNATPEAEAKESVDKIVYRSGTVFEGQIVEGTKTLIDDPDRYEMLLHNGTIISIKDRGQIETIVMDGQALDDPQQQGGRKRLRELLLDRQRKKQASEKEAKRELLTAKVEWVLGDAKRGHSGSEPGSVLKEGDRVHPGETVDLNSMSRIQMSVVGRIRLALEQGTRVDFKTIHVEEESGRLVLEFDFPRGGLWLEAKPEWVGKGGVLVRTQGLSLRVAEGLFRFQESMGGEIKFSHYTGPDLVLTRESDLATLSLPQGSSVLLTRKILSGEEPFTPRRKPVDDFNEWLDFQRWKPVEYNLPIQFDLVSKTQMDPKPVQPLIGLPSEKFVFQDLQPIRVTGLAPLFSAYQKALGEFRKDVGRPPTEEEGLDALRVSPAGVEGWKGPYLSNDTPLIDPWNQPFRYSVIQAGQSELIDLYSIGENGIDEQGFGDDLR